MTVITAWTTDRTPSSLTLRVWCSTVKQTFHHRNTLKYAVHTEKPLHLVFGTSWCLSREWFFSFHKKLQIILSEKKILWIVESDRSILIYNWKRLMHILPEKSPYKCETRCIWWITRSPDVPYRHQHSIGMQMGPCLGESYSKISLYYIINVHGVVLRTEFYHVNAFYFGEKLCRPVTKWWRNWKHEQNIYCTKDRHENVAQIWRCAVVVVVGGVCVFFMACEVNEQFI